MSFEINGLGALKVVTPSQWRGLVINFEDAGVSVGLTNDEYTGIYVSSHSFDIQVLYNNNWVTPLCIKTPPTFKNTVSSHSPSLDSFDSFSSNGFACQTYCFDGSNRGSNMQEASWTANTSKFTFNRDNSVGGKGIFHWKFNSNALNLGEVVIFAKS